MKYIKKVHFQDRATITSREDAKLLEDIAYIIDRHLQDIDIEVFLYCYKDYLRDNQSIYTDNIQIVDNGSRELLYARDNGEEYQTREELEEYERVHCYE